MASKETAESESTGTLRRESIFGKRGSLPIPSQFRELAFFLHPRKQSILENQDSTFGEIHLKFDLPPSLLRVPCLRVGVVWPPDPDFAQVSTLELPRYADPDFQGRNALPLLRELQDTFQDY